MLNINVYSEYIFIQSQHLILKRVSTQNTFHKRKTEFKLKQPIEIF